MHDYNTLLKDKLNAELQKICVKSDLMPRDLELAHAITDTIKNIDKISALESGTYPAAQMISHAEISTPSGVVSFNSTSDFANLINGKDCEKVWRVIEELAEAVMLSHPKLYRSFCDKMRDI